jgi:hypothetical protein
MTDEERWKSEGRTREALREAKRNLAALKADIEEYAKKLEDASGSLRHFLSKPVGSGPTGMSSLQYTLNFFKSLISLDVQQKLADFESETERAQKLEKTIQDFEQ